MVSRGIERIRWTGQEKKDADQRCCYLLGNHSLPFPSIRDGKTSPRIASRAHPMQNRHRLLSSQVMASCDGDDRNEEGE